MSIPRPVIVSAAYTDNTPTPTVEGLKQSVRNFHATYTDIRITVEEQIAEGEKVVNLLRGEGTYRGGQSGVPDTAIGKHVVISGVDIFRVVNGKIVERSTRPDELAWFQQLGIIPALGSSE